MPQTIGPVGYYGNSVGPVAYDPRDIGHIGAHQDTRNLGALMNLPPSGVKPGLPRLNTQHELATGLIHAYPILSWDETELQDFVGTLDLPRNGTTATKAYSPEIGSAVQLGGGNSYRTTIGSTSPINTATSGTVAAWFRCDTAGEYHGVVSSWEGGGSTERFWLGQWLDSDNNALRFQAKDTGLLNIAAMGTESYADGEWHLAVGTFESLGYVKLYVDGQLIATSATTFGTAGFVDGSHFEIGAWEGNTSTYGLSGDFADVRIWNRALSAAEISRMFDDPWSLYEVTAKPEYPVLDTSNPLSDSVVVALPMSEGSGATIADVSGNGNHGAVDGATWITDDEHGPVLEFDGTDDKVDLNTQTVPQLGTNERGSVSFWIKATSLDRGAIYSEGRSTTDAPLVMIESPGTSNQIRFWMRDDTSTTYWVETLLNTTSGPIDGTWHHVAVTLDDSFARIYVDGILEDSEAVTGTGTATVDRATIGCLGRDDDAIFFEGQIADFLLFDRALPASDVADLAEDPWLLYLDGDAPAAVNITGTGDADLPSFSTAGTGTVTSTTISGTGAASLPSFQTAGTGGQLTSGPTASTLPSFTAAGTGSQKHTGTGAVSLPSYVAGGAGGIPSNVTGVGAATLPSFTTAATGSQKHTGTGASSLPSFATAGTGGLVYQTKPVRPIVDTGHGLAVGLVGAWAFTEGSGTEITDLSGNGNSGTASASSWGSDSEIGPYWKNSSSGTPYVTIPAAAFSGISTAITISAHMKHDGSGAVAWSRVLGFDASSETILALRDSTNQRAYGAINTGTGVVSTSPRAGTAYDGSWHNITLVWDGSTLSFYQDGVLQGSVAATGTLSISGDFGIGRSTEASAAYDPGLQIGDCRVWDRALSLAEIQSLTSDPWALYEGTASDLTGTGNIDLPQPQVAAAGNLISDASAVLPNFGTSGAGKLKAIGSSAAVLPMFSLSGQGHRVLTGALPITGTPPTLWNTAERNTEIEGELELGIDKGSWEFQVGVTIDGTLHMTGNDASLQWRFFNITRFPSMKARVYNRLLSLIEEGEFYPVAYEQDRLFTVDLTRRVSPAQIVIQELSAGFGMSHEHFSLKYERRRWWWEIRVAFQEEVTLEFFEQQLANDPPHLPRDNNYNIPPVWLRMDRSDYVHPARSESPTGTHVTFRFEAQLTPIS